MIVNATDEGWQIISQPAHGLLAGQIAMQFRVDLQAIYWCETLAAIIQHDDLKNDFHGTSHLSACGAPQDFTAVEFKAAEREQECQRRLQATYEKHVWIGLLQSKHIDCLYAGKPVSPGLKVLIARERKHRQQLLRSLEVDPSELGYAYELLHWCDRCSLILCQNQIPAMHRRLEIMEGLTRERFYLFQREDETLCVDPWPFASGTFDVQVEYRLLRQLAYSSDDQLRKSLQQVPVQTTHWKFQW